MKVCRRRSWVEDVLCNVQDDLRRRWEWGQDVTGSLSEDDAPKDPPRIIYPVRTCELNGFEWDETI